MVVFVIRGGASWGTLGDPARSGTQNVYPKCGQNGFKAAKNGPKISRDPFLGPKTPKSLPGASQDPLAAQSLPDAVSRPVLASISTPRNFRKHCFSNGFFLPFKQKPLLPASGHPKAHQNEPNMVHPGGFQSDKIVQKATLDLSLNF